MKYLILLLLALATTLRAGVSFDGYLVTAEGPLFILSSGSEKKSGWLKLNQAFDGFTLVSFDPKADSLVVQKGEARETLALRQSRIREGEAPPQAEEIAKSEKVLVALLARLKEAEAARVDGANPDAVLFLKMQVEKKTAELRALRGGS